MFTPSFIVFAAVAVFVFDVRPGGNVEKNTGLHCIENIARIVILRRSHLAHISTSNEPSNIKAIKAIKSIKEIRIAGRTKTADFELL